MCLMWTLDRFCCRRLEYGPYVFAFYLFQVIKFKRLQRPDVNYSASETSNSYFKNRFNKSSLLYETNSKGLKNNFL